MLTMRNTGRALRLAAILALAAGSAGAQGGGGAGGRVRVVKADTTKDSASTRLVIKFDEMGKLIRELIASRQMEEALVLAMREDGVERIDARRFKELSDSLRALSRKTSGLTSRLELTCRYVHVPDGYIGVQFTEAVPRMGRGPVRVEAVRMWPEIDSVVPNSPASKAGLKPGDHIVAIAGRDPRGQADFGDLLRPGAQVTVKLLRAGEERDVTVSVEKRPPNVEPPCRTFEDMVAADLPQARAIARPGTRPRGDGPPPPMPPAMIVSPMPAGGFAYSFSSNSSSVAGAELRPLDDDWRQSLGVDNGLLVLRVVQGTPARDAGLRGNDVIIAADGQPLRSMLALRRIISNASTNAIKLQVIRAGKTQELTLRWTEREP